MIRDLNKVETFEDIVRAVDEKIFPTHLFDMLEAAGEKNPYKQYRVMMRRCYIAACIFDWVYLMILCFVGTLIYKHESVGHVVAGAVLVVIVVLMIISDMIPHIVTSRRQAEERAKPFVEFFKRLCVEQQCSKLDEQSLLCQIDLAKEMLLIPQEAVMDEFIKKY